MRSDISEDPTPFHCEACRGVAIFSKYIQLSIKNIRLVDITSRQNVLFWAMCKIHIMHFDIFYKVVKTYKNDLAIWKS